MKSVILALGNELMKDDGVGLKVGRILAQKGYNVIEVGTDIFRLQRHYNGEERLIIIDAILSEEFKPGKIIHLSGEEVFKELKAEIRSAHFMGAIDGLKLLMALDERLKNVELHFIGIVAKEVGLGVELSKEVEEAVPNAIKIIEELAED